MKNELFQKLKILACCPLILLATHAAFPDDYRKALETFQDARNGKHSRNMYDFITYFYIDEIEREDGEIEIEFNTAVDPASVSRESFRINGEPLPDNLPYKLSRKGTKIVIPEIPAWWNRTISIEVVGVLSVNGTEIERIPPIFMDHGDEYEREEDLEFVYWYWYDNNGGKAFEP